MIRATEITNGHGPPTALTRLDPLRTNSPLPLPPQSKNEDRRATLAAHREALVLADEERAADSAKKEFEAVTQNLHHLVSTAHIAGNALLCRRVLLSLCCLVALTSVEAGVPVAN